MHPKTATNPNGSGRPPTIIDWAEVQRLADLQLPLQQIADALGISYVTLQARAVAEGLNLEDYYKNRSALSNARLLAQAERHSERWGPMTIFLLKNRLGYRDENSPGRSGAPPVQVNITFVSPQALASGQVTGQVVEGQAEVLPALTPGQATEPPEAKLT